MRIGMPLSYGAGDFLRAAGELPDYERAGLDIVFAPEAYTFDSISQLGYIAAKTSTLEIASDILNIYSRTPALLAMTAAGLDSVSGGRFTLGIGASGPQVVEGFHGVPYAAPLGRTREVVEICRLVWRREPVSYQGRYYHLPLGPEQGGTGLGKALKLINQPVRERIPVILAAIGPKNVALAAELFEGWHPFFYYPEQAAGAFGPALAEGTARRDSALGPLQVIADSHLAITEDDEEESAALQSVRVHLALYIGGMGAKGKNFYNELVCRYGFEEAAGNVQDLYLSGRKAEAAAAVPEELARGLSLIGPALAIKDRIDAFAASGATTVNVKPVAATHEQRVRDVARLREICS